MLPQRSLSLQPLGASTGRAAPRRTRICSRTCQELGASGEAPHLQEEEGREEVPQVPHAQEQHLRRVQEPSQPARWGSPDLPARRPHQGQFTNWESGFRGVSTRAECWFEGVEFLGPSPRKLGRGLSARCSPDRDIPAPVFRKQRLWPPDVMVCYIIS